MLITQRACTCLIKGPLTRSDLKFRRFEEVETGGYIIRQPEEMKSMGKQRGSLISGEI